MSIMYTSVLKIATLRNHKKFNLNFTNTHITVINVSYIVILGFIIAI